MEPHTTATLILLLPLLSAAVIACFLRRRGLAAAAVSLLAAGALAVLSFQLIFAGEDFRYSMEWLRVGEFSVSLGFLFDDLAALMLLVVSGVGFFIHLFSLGYMRQDPGLGRYFGGLSIFMFSMLGIVFADNLFMVFVFWELVGFSSYLLINHYFERQAAADASKKAFIVNRIGDFGFLLGIIWTYWTFGTVNLSELADASVGGIGFVPAALPLLLFCGAVGKSAQFPLHVWLPDAMEGPTPVSALIHAATMVAAGIYMLCRISFLMVPDALTVVLWVGVITAVYAAFCALAQRDIKRILAYSTLSQLGYMVAAFGLGSLEVTGGSGVGTAVVAAGVGAAMFHLTTHAFFKALLFLGSGSIIHACHHEQDIFRMGGLARKMPVTFATFTLGVLALIGFPFLAGFFSKDAILYLALQKNFAVFLVLAGTAVLTAWYMTRLWVIAFFGKARSDQAAHAHENGPVMLLPLVVLAVLSVAGGYSGLYPDVFSGILGEVPQAHGAAHTLVLAVSVGVLALGVGIAALVYRPSQPDPLERRARGFYRPLAERLYFDRFYDHLVARVQQPFAHTLNFIEQIFLSGLIIRGMAGLVALVGIGFRALHVGNLHAYVYWFLGGVVLFWALVTGLF